MKTITTRRTFILIATIVLLTAAGSAQTLSREKVKQIEQLVTAKMSKDRIPALSIALAQNGKVIWANGYGMADIENFVPAKPTTAYRSASIGKTITATAVMQLAEKGKLDLDAPVWQYCKAFPTKKWLLSSRHLLAHLGGIRHYGGPNTEAELYSTKHYKTVAESLEVFKNDPLAFEPGTDYLYSTYGYNTLGCVIEGASGMSYLDYLRENIFKPAGMLNTRDDSPFAVIPNRAAGYFINKRGELENSRHIDMSNRLPAGGFLTTAEDLALFASAVMEHKLVSQKTLELMLTPQKTKAGKTIEYGLGWGLFPGEDWYGEREAFHGGQSPKVSNILYMLPGRRFAVGIQTNLEGVSDRTGLAAKIAQIVLDLNSSRIDTPSEYREALKNDLVQKKEINMIQGIRTVIYHVVDLEKAKAWYSKILGTKPYFDEPFYVGFNVGGFELGLDPDMKGIKDGNKTVAYWGVKDIKAEFERLVKLGAEKHSDIMDVGGGILKAEFKDPFGNIFGIIENPHFKIEDVR
jgi:CubicO group peptidase (beta-lactamase class C family)/predicted enzyme related to lactoylglutathione lyase